MTESTAHTKKVRKPVERDDSIKMPVEPQPVPTAKRRRRSKTSRFRRKFFRWIGQAITIGCVMALGLFLFSFLGRISFFAELVGNFRVHLLLMLLFTGVITLVRNQNILAGVTWLAVAWFAFSVLSLRIPASNPPAGEHKLKIMSYNVLASNWRADEVVEQIREADPDVISILEYARNWHFRLECLSERYPFQIRIPRWHGFGIAMFSKYPFSETQIHQLTKTRTDNPFVVTNVEFEGQTIRLAALHVLSPINRHRMNCRNFQLKEVAELLGSNPTPTVVMGDFNCTTWSPFLQDFLKLTNYRDSRQGFGVQASWPADKWWARIPIDHAFVSEDVHVHSRELGSPSSSDHLAIIFEISAAK